MEHNWYETAITASIPHRIVSVVDWASDSPMPMPVIHGECGPDRCSNRVLCVVTHLGVGSVDGHLPNLGAFVPPGSTFDSVTSAPLRGPGRRLGKALGKSKGRPKARVGIEGECIYGTSSNIG